MLYWNNKKVPAEDIAASLMQAFSGSLPVGQEGHVAELMAQQVRQPPNISPGHLQELFENDNDSQQNGRPRAYLNFATFDDRFNLVRTTSGLRQVQQLPDSLQDLTVDKMAVEKTGFLYVYTSNESGQDVCMDNLVVNVISGPLLEETHYYPFGLTMQGISHTALGRLENRYLFAGKEIQKDEFGIGDGLGLYDFGARMYDQQIGRFQRPDRFAELYRAPHTERRGQILVC